MELTHRCHLDCVHCYLDDNHDHDSQRGELSTAEVCGAIDQLRVAGCLFLTITGGEVFLRKDLFEILSHARRVGLAVILYTSGTHLTPARLDRIAALYLRRVELSVYSSDAEVHDRITQLPGSHAKTMQALHGLLARAVPVRIKAPIMRDNFDSYPGLKALAEKLGIALLADVTVNPSNGGGRATTAQRMSAAQLVEFYEKPEIQAFAQVKRRLPQAQDPICAIGKRSCVIGPNGDVRTCLGFATPIGNLRTQSFAEIWNRSPVLARLRTLAVTDVTVCSQCEKSAYCNRCAGMAALEDGDFDGPSRWACHVAAAKEKAALAVHVLHESLTAGLYAVGSRAPGSRQSYGGARALQAERAF